MFDFAPVVTLEVRTAIYFGWYADLPIFLSEDGKLLEDVLWKNSWGYLYAVKALQCFWQMSGLTYGDNLGPDTFSSERQDSRK